jgi:hypothetical protein
MGLVDDSSTLGPILGVLGRLFDSLIVIADRIVENWLLASKFCWREIRI